MDLYKRKLILLGLLLGVYCLVSFWVPYSKSWFLKDIMQTQARLYFATQSVDNLRERLIRKAEAIDVPLADKQVTVQTINGEIIYLELDLNIPYNLLFYHSTLHFEPKIFGLIRGFEVAGRPADEIANQNEALIALSDSTKKFLQNKTLRNYIEDFYAH